MMEHEMNQKIPLIAVVGPTASGKTALAISLAQAFDGEVVSADSMQIYTGMNIATAKPTEQEMQGIPHHLLGILDPQDSAFSVAQYASLAHGKIEDIYRRGHIPVLAGGTGLYIDAVTQNISFSSICANPDVRQRLANQAQAEGNEAMLSRLNAIDPALAKKLHPNNLGRILRALEVYELTGVAMSEHQRQSRMAPPKYRLCMLGIDYQDRAQLYERINRRVDLMLENGLVEEARTMTKQYGGTARQAIGYKELEPYFQGTLSLEICTEHLKRATRRYAKRQITWFRKDERIEWLAVTHETDFEELAVKAQKAVHKSGIL